MFCVAVFHSKAFHLERECVNFYHILIAWAGFAFCPLFHPPLRFYAATPVWWNMHVFWELILQNYTVLLRLLTSNTGTTVVCTYTRLQSLNCAGQWKRVPHTQKKIGGLFEREWRENIVIWQNGNNRSLKGGKFSGSYLIVMEFLKGANKMSRMSLKGLE